MMNDQHFMAEAIHLARENMNNNLGGPFGCVIVKEGQVISRGTNRVTSSNDPTAHAEIVAIREACTRLNSFQLTDCTLYTTCEPCPMCLGAIYWARPSKVIYAGTKNDAALAGFDDQFIYRELALPDEIRKIPFESIGRKEAMQLFEEWKRKEPKITY